MSWREIIHAGEPQRPRGGGFFGGEPSILSRSFTLAITGFLAAMCCLAVVQIVTTAVYDRLAGEPVVGEVNSCQGAGTRGESCTVRYEAGGKSYNASVAMTAEDVGTPVTVYAHPGDPADARTVDVGLLVVFPLAAVGLLIATGYQVGELRAARRSDDDASPRS